MMKTPLVFLILSVAVDIALSSERRCEITQTEKLGIIDSHPLGEARTRSCSWIITVPPERRVELYFPALNILNPNCSKNADAADYLTIGKTIPKEMQLFIFICNRTTPISLKVENVTSVNITLHVGDETTSKSQFRLVYKIVDDSAECTEEFREPVGMIASPNYPGEIPSPVTCTYKIIMPDRSMFKSIELKLMHFDIQTNSSVCTNYLRLRDSVDPPSGLSEYLCSGLDPEVVYSSSGSVLTLRFSTFHPLKRFQGFRASYKMIPTESALNAIGAN